MLPSSMKPVPPNIFFSDMPSPYPALFRSSAWSFRTSLLPRRLGLRGLRRQRPHMGQRELRPLPDRRAAQCLAIDEDIARDRTPAHEHGTGARTAERFVMTLLADPHQQAATEGAGNHVAVQHEAGPAEHLLLRYALSLPGALPI